MEPPPRPSTDHRRRSIRIAAIQATADHQAAEEGNPVDLDAPDLLTKTESLASEGSAATGFTARTKDAIISLYGDECWHCGAQEDLECAHVVGAGRRDLCRHLASLGRTNLRSVNDQENGIRLCVLCHRTLAKIELAAWVFIPSNLGFFIAAEKSDYERRLNEYNTSGTFPVRKCPGTKDYLESCGGMYDAYMLRHYTGLGNWQPGRSTFLPSSKHWHGDAMITLQKGFLALGLYGLILPKELEQLSKLYQLNDTGLPQDSATPSLGQYSNPDRGDPNGPRAPPSPDPSPSASERGKRPPTRGANSRGRGHQGGRGNRPSQDLQDSHEQQAGGQPHKRPFKQQSRSPSPKRIKVTTGPWIWGPLTTGQKQVELYNREKTRRQAWSRQNNPKGVEQIALQSPSPEASETLHPTRRKGRVEHPRVVEWLSETS